MPGTSQDLAFSGALEPGGSTSRRFPLEAGEYLELEVAQDGIDVVVRLFSEPDGEPLREVDSLTGTSRPERLRWLADRSGTYRLEIAAWEGASAAGRFSVEVVARRPATKQDHMIAVVEGVHARGERLLAEGSEDEAIEVFEQAVALWRGQNEPSRLADALYRLGRLYEPRDRDAAIAAFEAVLEVLETAPNPWQAATTRQRLGSLHYDAGRLERALELYRQALPGKREAGDLVGEARVLNNLGLVYDLLGKVAAAREHYDRALELSRRLALPAEEARTLHNRGKLYLDRGRPADALLDLERAYEIRRGRGDRRGQATTLTAIGQTHERAGRLEAALDAYRKAYALRLATRDRQGQAITLGNVANALERTGRLAEARAKQQEALAIFRETGDRRNEAVVLRNLGRVEDALGESERALASLRRALEIFDATGDRRGRVSALRGLAHAERRRGDLDAARGHVEAALAEIERLRVEPGSRTLRYAYFAAKQQDYDFYVDLLMREEDVAAALGASERARARSQLDALGADAAVLGRVADPALRTSLRELEERINARERLRRRLLDEGAPEARLAALERELRVLLRDHDRLRERIRSADPRAAALSSPRPLDAGEIQRRVVDPETLLLEIDLGPERSYLWAVTPDEIRAVELPPRAEIEALARRVYDLLRQSRQTAARVPAELALAELAELLLAPVAELLTDRRLLVVAEGALQYLPFAALPAPGSEDGAPLALRHEVVAVPSASILDALRRAVADRAPPAGTVAVVADPVFTADDPRFREREDAGLTDGVRGGDARRLERLPFSRREAEAILALAPAASRLAALGFDARRELVLSGRLAGFRVVHFATHGELNAEHPELSQILLSHLDPRGRPLEGSVFAHEIDDLALPVELVVLSACESALGAEIGGEGILGLPNAFLQAGAARVVVSLWRVDDRATAELMTRFYDALLVRGLRPAAALRAAQSSIRREGPWRAPYYWAGFVLQGEWR